ncbi:hypothetical protein Tco_1554777 [Tanacetum coccineum]
MDGLGVGSSLCVMLSLAPSGPFFLVAQLVWLAGVGFERVGKGGSRVLTPDLVVMAKVGASGLGVSLFPITERIWENWVGGLVPVLLEEDASSSKRFLPAIARDSF